MLSSTTKYALKTIAHLREEKCDSFVSVDDLAREIGAPRQYLAKVMKTLAAKGFVVSKKGPNGGIKLPKAKKPKRTLWDLCKALEDPAVNESCFLERRGCDARHSCIFHKRWDKLRSQLRQFLSSIPLN